MTLREAEKINNYDEVDGIEIDGIWYTILDTIDGYYYLIDLDNPNRFLIMKDEGEDLVSVKDEDEFNLALMKFGNSLGANTPTNDPIKSLREMFGLINTNQNEKYEEIIKLDNLLKEANIPHDFRPINGGFQILYFGKKEKPGFFDKIYSNRGVRVICSAVEHRFSYGHENDTIEIQGLLTEEEHARINDTVLGNLSADDVFRRIKNHWDKICR